MINDIEDSKSNEVSMHPDAEADIACKDDSSPEQGTDVDRSSVSSTSNRWSNGDKVPSNVSLLRASFGVSDDSDRDDDVDDNEFYYPASERTPTSHHIVILEAAANDSTTQRDVGVKDDEGDGDELQQEERRKADRPAVSFP